MKPESSIRGFRVPVLFEGDTECKYLIFINYNLCRFVKDVINHLKEIFHLDYDIYLTVEDYILPENEVIHVLFSDDDLKICRKRGPEEKTDTPAESSEVTKSTNQERKGVKRKPIIDNGIGDCLKMLLGKKNELQNKLSECAVSVCAIKSPTSDGNHDENQECSYEYSESGKRKRKRKRTKKSSGNDISFASESSSVVSEDTVQTSYNMGDTTITELRVSLDNENANKNHIYFNEDEVETTNETEDTIQPESNNDDWKRNLLSLATEPQENKVFERSSL